MYKVKYVLKTSYAPSRVKTTYVDTTSFANAIGAVSEYRAEYQSEIEFVSVAPCRSDLLVVNDRYKLEANNVSAI